jgi:tetratricopeptide (TPR) repeat protein
MGERPYRVFVSAVNLDLKSFRQASADLLKENAATICPHGPLEVVYEEFFPPDYQSVWRMLRQHILGCDAVICLVGHAYGGQPDNMTSGTPRRSYSQMEFDMARALDRPVFLYLADDAAALDPHAAEDKDRRQLQQKYREELQRLDQMRYRFGTKDDLLEQLRLLVLPPPSPRKPNNLPYETLGTLFKGRQASLEALRKKLNASRGRAVGVLARQSIHGMGGVGKTRLAVEYGLQSRADYTALLFASAETPADLRRNLADLVGPSVLDLKELREVREEEVRFAGVLNWLQNNPGWLLILDNVDSEKSAEEVERLLPRLQTGHLLITSRLKEWGAGVEPLELDVLDPTASSEFLLERTAGRRRPTPNDDGDARSLAEALDGLALALEQAGAYVSHVRCSLADYLARWRKQDEQVLQWTDWRQMKYPKSVATTWETTREQLSESARTLLEMLAFLAPDPIPEWLLSGEKARPLATEALSGADVTLALADLEKYSMLRREMAGEGWMLLVHRVVQETTRWRVPSERRVQRLAQMLGILDVAATGHQDIRTWPSWEWLRPHLSLSVERADAAGIAYPTGRLMNDLGLFLKAKALYAEAEPLLRRALAIAERHFGRDHPSVAVALNNLATLLMDVNCTSEAEDLSRRAMAVDERAFGSDHPKVARHLSNLGILLQTTNRLLEAEQYYRRSLEIGERYLRPDDPDISIRLNNLAGLLQATNREDEAEPLLRRSLQIVEQVFEPNHAEVAVRLTNLANLLQVTNRFEEAELLYRRALAIREHSFGPDHSHVANTAINLGRLLLDTNRRSAAEPLFRRALAINERTFGPDHPDVASSLNNLGLFLRDSGRVAEAETLFRRALESGERSLGPEHTSVADYLTNLGGILRDTSRFKEAEPLLRRALEINERSLGTDHPSTCTTLDNLARLLNATNRNSEAESLYRRALEYRERSRGPDHPDVASSLNNLALLLTDSNRLAESEPLFRRALDISERTFGRDHPDVATTLGGLANLLHTTNRLAEAEPLLRRALEICERSYEADHPKVAVALNNLSELLRETNRLSEAEPLIRRALTIGERSLGLDDPTVASYLNNLALILHSTGRLDEAETLFRRALAIGERAFGPDHPDVAHRLNNLATLHYATHRLAEAGSLLRRAVVISEHTFGSDHPAVATSLNNLASVLQEANRLDEAEPLFRRALAIDERSFGPNHPNVAKDLHNLACLLSSTKRAEAAEPLSRRVVEILLSFARRTGHKHPRFAVAVQNYRAVLCQLGRNDEEVRLAIENLKSSER